MRIVTNKISPRMATPTTSSSSSSGKRGTTRMLPSSSSSSSSSLLSFQTVKDLHSIFRSIEMDAGIMSLEEIEAVDDVVQLFGKFISIEKSKKQQERSIKRQKTSSRIEMKTNIADMSLVAMTTVRSVSSSSSSFSVPRNRGSNINRSNVVLAVDDDIQRPIPIPLQVLTLVSVSGFLKSPDLGRLLLQTHPSITSVLTPDVVYRTLYRTRRQDRWSSPTRNNGTNITTNTIVTPSTLRSVNSTTIINSHVHTANDWIPETTLQARGHCDVFHALERPPVTKTKLQTLPYIIPRPVLNSNNTIVIVSLWILSQKVYSHQLTYNELERLTRTGHSYVHVPKSIVNVAKLTFQKDKSFVRELRRIRRQNHKKQHQHQLKQQQDKVQDPTDQPTGIRNKNSSHHNVIEPKEEKEIVVTKEEEAPFITAKIHAVRLDSHEICTLYDSNRPRYEMRRAYAAEDGVHFPLQRALQMKNNDNDNNKEKDQETKVNIDGTQHGTNLHPYGSSATTESSSNTDMDGDDLVARWYKAHPDAIRNVGGLTFQMSLTDRLVSLSTTTSSSSSSSSSSSTTRRRTDGVGTRQGQSSPSSSSSSTLHIEAKVLGGKADQCETLRPRNGVNPYHILQGLAGWR